MNYIPIDPTMPENDEKLNMFLTIIIVISILTL